MTSLQWGHDLAVMESAPPQPKLGHPAHFNGAMTLRSWRGSLTMATVYTVTILQWGHDLAVMESGRPNAIT